MANQENGIFALKNSSISMEICIWSLQCF